VQVQPGLLTRDLPSAAELAAALAPAKAIAHVNGDGLTLVQLDRGGDSGLPTGDPRHWRGAMLINGYLVGLALYAPKGSALAGRGGQRLILQLAENLLDARMNRPRQYEEPPAVAVSWIRGETLVPHTTHRRRIWKA